MQSLKSAVQLIPQDLVLQD
ncbi:Protein of unknown function [Lactobacillus helveticus CIRM-BIA 104]|uniref:Uncharacterized protein n=1 Tax=Lactobacillus helveticus CIRM-BIA 104 TaxID=1226333 RepID=U6F7G7_LACHE|nr:Protein of unknown function [Lactobacillus helveticus CIRM-BIA 104]